MGCFGCTWYGVSLTCLVGFLPIARTHAQDVGISALFTNWNANVILCSTPRAQLSQAVCVCDRLRVGLHNEQEGGVSEFEVVRCVRPSHPVYYLSLSAGDNDIDELAL